MDGQDGTGYIEYAFPWRDSDRERKDQQNSKGGGGGHQYIENVTDGGVPDHSRKWPVDGLKECIDAHYQDRLFDCHLQAESAQLKIEPQDVGEQEGEEYCTHIKSEHHPPRKWMVPENNPGS